MQNFKNNFKALSYKKYDNLTNYRNAKNLISFPIEVIEFPKYDNLTKYSVFSILFVTKLQFHEILKI